MTRINVEISIEELRRIADQFKDLPKNAVVHLEMTSAASKESAVWWYEVVP